MNSKTISFENNRSIDVYDDLFNFAEMSYWNAFVKGSLFKTTGQDVVSYKTSAQQLHSTYSMEDVTKMGFIDSEGFKFLDQKYNFTSKKIHALRVNLSTPAERNLVHTDGVVGKTLIYYVNLDWELEWGGHTLFMDDTLNDVKYTCLYKPGRVVVFDASIPHMIMTPSVFCPINRYTFVIQT